MKIQYHCQEPLQDYWMPYMNENTISLPRAFFKGLQDIIYG